METRFIGSRPRGPAGSNGSGWLGARQAGSSRASRGGGSLGVVAEVRASSGLVRRCEALVAGGVCDRCGSAAGGHRAGWQAHCSAHWTTGGAIRIGMSRQYASSCAEPGRRSPIDRCCEEFHYYVKPPADADGQVGRSAAGRGPRCGKLRRRPPRPSVETTRPAYDGGQIGGSPWMKSWLGAPATGANRRARHRSPSPKRRG